MHDEPIADGLNNIARAIRVHAYQMGRVAVSNRALERIEKGIKELLAREPGSSSGDQALVDALAERISKKADAIRAAVQNAEEPEGV